MSEEMDEAIERLAICLEFDLRHRLFSKIEISRKIHEELDPILTPKFPIPAEIVHGHYQGHSHLPMQAIKGWTFRQATEFINLVACSKESSKDKE